MSLNYLTLGPVPANESCAQVGVTPDYATVAQEECHRYMELIQKWHPDACLTVKGFQHEFGMYYEVIALYEEGNEEQERQALYVEAHLPEAWTDEEPPVKGILRKRIMERKP